MSRGKTFSALGFLVILLSASLSVGSSLFETLPRGVPFVAPLVVGVEMLALALLLTYWPKLSPSDTGPAPRRQGPRGPVPSRGLANGGTAVEVQGRRFVFDASGALRLED